MLKYYIDEDGELKSSQNSDLVVQTSKGVDTIVVELPYEDTLASSTASITIRNPKGVESYEYLMTYTPSTTTSPQKLSFLLNDAWFSSVKGNYEFTVRIYGTSNYNITDNGSLELVVSESENVSVLVFTKGYYKVLEAINVGETPTPPTPSVYNELIGAIGLKANKTYVDEKDGELNTRLEEIEDNYVDEEAVQEIYDNNIKVKKIVSSSNPMEIVVQKGGSSTTTERVSISLKDDIVSVEEEQDGTIPNVEVLTSQKSKKVEDEETPQDTIQHKNRKTKIYLGATSTPILNIKYEYDYDNGEGGDLEHKIFESSIGSNSIYFANRSVSGILQQLTLTMNGLSFIDIEDESNDFSFTWKQVKELIDDLM